MIYTPTEDEQDEDGIRNLHSDHYGIPRRVGSRVGVGVARLAVIILMPWVIVLIIWIAS